MLHSIIAVLAAAVISLPAGVHAYTYGLQLSMQFEDAAGSTAVDSSPNAHVASLQADAALTASGHTGGGLVLDGNGDYATFADRSLWNCTDEITVTAWVNLTDGGVILERGSYIRPFALIVNNSGTVTWALYPDGGSDTRITSTATVTWNQWHHLAATYSAVAGSAKAYLDGTQILSRDLTGSFGTGDNTWKIGSRANSYWLGGTIDDLRVYSRPLSQAEIQDIIDGTETAMDETEPSVPQNVTAQAASPRQVQLTWERSTDNVRVAGYKIYKDGVYVSTTTRDADEYLVYWLTPSTQYDFTVTAFDYEGNVSAPSAAATATTDDEVVPDMYVGGWNVNNEMTKITPACMETLRTKRVVGATKSFGGSMVSGYSRLNDESSPYYLPAASVGVPVVSDFVSNTIVKGDCGERYPYSARPETLGVYVANLGGAATVDAAFVYFHNMEASIYNWMVDYPYVLRHNIEVLDSLQAAYPDVKFIYTCSGVVGESDLGKSGNTHSMRYGEMLRNRKQGLVPIYDMASILAVDDAGDTSTFANPFSGYTASLREEITAGWQDANDRIIKPDTTATWQIPASGLHPNAAGEKRMAKGMTLVLAKMFCEECFPQDGGGSTVHSWVTDSLAIRAILDANGVTGISVDGVVEEKTWDGRVSTLSMRDPNAFTLTTLPSVIGDLDSLKILYIYSNELTSLPEELGNLTALQQLNISENKLTTLPASIVNLTNLMQLTMNDNLFTTLPEALTQLTSLVDNYGIILDSNSICNTAGMSTTLTDFLDAKSLNWQSKQSCGSGISPVAMASSPQLPFRLEHSDASLTVRWEAGTAMSLALYSMDGAVVDKAAYMTGGEASFDVRTVPAGLYLLQLEQDGRTHTVKVTIIK